MNRYGRDYYINHAKHATGQTPNSTFNNDNDDDDEWHPISAATPVVQSANDVYSNKVSASHQHPNANPHNTTHYDYNNNNKNINNINTDNKNRIVMSPPGFRLARRAYSMRSLRYNLYGSGNSLGGSSETSEEQPHRHHPHSDHSKQHYNRHRPRSAAGFFDYDTTCIERNDSHADGAGKTCRRPLSSTIGYSGQLFNKQSDLTTASATAAFEANMLRGNLRRDSFRVSSNGTANFVENPLFEDD